jgi:hypothetical protein
MNAERIADILLNEMPRSPSAAPTAPGFYAWWCRREHVTDPTPAIPYEPRLPMSSDWSLLYAGISPSSIASSRNLAARLVKNHARGNIGGSTFRLSLASLLIKELCLEPRSGGDRARLTSETALTHWLDRCCGVTFAVVDRPWELETAVIQQLNPPLNLEGGTHPFRLHVQERRATLRKACGL